MWRGLQPAIKPHDSPSPNIFLTVIDREPEAVHRALAMA